MNGFRSEPRQTEFPKQFSAIGYANDESVIESNQLRKVNLLTQEVDKYKKHLHILEEESKIQKDESKSHKEKVDSLEKNIDKHKKYVGKISSDIKSQKDYVDELAKDVKTQYKNLENQEKKVDEVKKAVEHIQGKLLDINQISTTVNELVQTISRIKDKLDGLDKLVNVVDGELQTVANIEKMISIIVNGVNDLISRFNKLLGFSAATNLPSDVSKINAMATKSVEDKKLLSVLELQDQLTKLQSLVRVVENHVMIGEPTDIPHQPEVVTKAGVHSVAPLALAVNGAAVFHNIGYVKNDKGLDSLFYDPKTERIVIVKK